MYQNDTRIIRFLLWCALLWFETKRFSQIWFQDYFTDTPAIIKVNWCELSHWSRNNMAVMFQTTFSNAVSWTKIYQFWLKFHWNLIVKVQLTIVQHWLRQWLGTNQATGHCVKQWGLVYWRIYASLGLNEIINLKDMWQTYTKTCNTAKKKKRSSYYDLYQRNVTIEMGRKGPHIKIPEIYILCLSLAHWGRLTRKCVINLSHHWFR